METTEKLAACNAIRCVFAAALVLGVGMAGRAQMPDPPGQPAQGVAPKHEAYLFAHMMHGDYWRLYYSVSLDGLHWKALNGGKRVFEDYRGHADIARGHNGRYDVVGSCGDDQPDINFWVSEGLITWTKHGDYVPDLTRVPDYPKAMARIGAPKLFFDEVSAQYLLTWHTTHALGKAVSRGCLRFVGGLDARGALVPGLGWNELPGLGQVQPASQGAARMHDPDSARRV